MPLTTIRERSAAALTTALQAEFDHTVDDIFLEIPPNREMGDLVWPGALPLARVFKKNPELRRNYEGTLPSSCSFFFQDPYY